MIGRYRLRDIARAWTEADAWISMYNEHPCSKPKGCNYYMATQWYAFWLNQVKNYALRGIGEGPSAGRQPSPTANWPVVPRLHGLTQGERAASSAKAAALALASGCAASTVAIRQVLPVPTAYTSSC